MLMAPFGAIVNAIRRSPVAATSAHFPKFMTTLQCRPRLHFLSGARSEEHTSELQSQSNLVCRLLLEKKMMQLAFSLLEIAPVTGVFDFVGSATLSWHLVKILFFFVLVVAVLSALGRRCCRARD